MTDLLSGAVRLGRAALFLSSHTDDSSKLPPSPKKKAPNNAALRTLSRAFYGASNLALSLWDGLTLEERERKRVVEERKTMLIYHMKNANSLEQWEAAAEELDLLEGNDKWKLDPDTGGCNADLIESRLRELEDARKSRDVHAMVHLIRTALSRDLGGMGKSSLYHHSHIGTKQLIERYVDCATETIEALVSVNLAHNVSYRELLEGLLFARQSYGRSALLLSGGSTFGMMHIGVIKTLFAADLLPRIVSGASAGSIVCAVLCTRTDEEIPALIREFPYGDLAVFDDEDCQTDLLSHVRKLLTEGSWSDIRNLNRVMKALLGDLTFQEAYNRTRRILNITVSSESVYELPRLLNYVTAPNVMIWSAVAASCSVPLVFTPASLLVKDPVTGEHLSWNATPQRWIDGSVDNDLPMTRLAEMFNVNHFIVSQVNPHVVPFLAKEENIKPYIHSDSVAQGTRQPGKGAEWLETMTSMAKDEALHRLHFLAELGIAPNLATKVQSILSQRYSGDINILPELAMQDIPTILSNPTSDFMLRCCLAGERATWPKTSRIRDRCAIELALDRAVLSLRARVVFSESQVDLRRMARGLSFKPIDPQDKKARDNQEAIKTEGRGGDDERTANGRRPQRRGSGSSVQLLARQRRILREGRDGSDTPDSDTDGEERPQTSGSWGRGTSSGKRNGPRLRRAAASQFNIHTGIAALPASPQEVVSAGLVDRFLAPPGLSRTGSQVPVFATGGEEDYEDWLSSSPEPAPPTYDGDSQAALINPVAVDIKVEDGHSSYEGASVQTDASLSDPDPYSGSWLHETSVESGPMTKETTRTPEPPGSPNEELKD